MPLPDWVLKQQKCAPGEFPECGCHYTNDDDGIHFCPLHRLADRLKHRLSVRVAACGCDGRRWQNPDFHCEFCQEDLKLLNEIGD